METSSPFYDQMQAAAREARRIELGSIAEAMRQSVPMTPHVQKVEDDPFLVKLTNELREGRFTPCPHLASPQPCFYQGWLSPRRLLCGECLRNDRTPLPKEENQRCDSCGKNDDENYRTVEVRIGAIVFLYGLCGSCNPRSDVLSG